MREIAGDLCGVVDAFNDGSRMKKREKEERRENHYMTGLSTGCSSIKAESAEQFWFLSARLRKLIFIKYSSFS